MTLRILQFGVTGQLATELLRQAPAPGREIEALSRGDCDLADPAACAAAVEARKPDLVIIAAAYTAVDRAEAEGDLVMRINAESPAAIALAARQCGAASVYVSSDYVFDGAKGAPYVEADDPHPANTYGRTKLEGEKGVWTANPRALILRTSWVISAHGKNFVKTMLRLAGEGAPLRVVDDQFGRPTGAADLASFILANATRLIDGRSGADIYGLFHFANAGETTWKQLAEAVFNDALGDGAPRVEPIATADRPAPATRPLRGTLDTSKLETVFGYTPRPWRAAVREIVAELKEAS